MSEPKVESAEFDWRRWWCPTGEVAEESDGYLDDPAGPFARYRDMHLVELADLDDVPCVVLLGEPGMGKSTEVNRYRQRLEADAVAVSCFDLGAATSLDTFATGVLADAHVSAAVNGSDEVVLVLDGLDELTFPSSRVVEELTRLFDKLPAERVKLRVASRPAAYTSELAATLKARWGIAKSVWLAQLTHSDVASAARARYGDAAVDFLKAVDERAVGVFASRPLTLLMLMSVWDSDGTLPKSRVDLFERAIRTLVGENHKRRVADRTVNLSVDERVPLARRLAAVSLLSGRSTVGLYRIENAPPEQVPLADVAATKLDEDSYVEVLGSGLFAVAGNASVRWTHRTILEFLAARQLTELPTATTDYLLADPQMPGRIAPPLTGVAAWYAAMSPQYRALVVAREPGLLLDPNLATAPEDDRRAITLGLLAGFDCGDIVDQRRYRGLAYPGMGDDLRPYLDAGRPRWMRREVMMMLADAQCRDLDGRFVEIIEQIAADQDVDDLGREVALATTAMFALDAATDELLLDRLLTVAEDHDAPWQLRAELLDQLWSRLPQQRLLDTIDAIHAEPAAAHRLKVRCAEGMASALRRGQLDLSNLPGWLDHLDPTGAATDWPNEWQEVVQAFALTAALVPETDNTVLEEAASLATRWLNRTYELFGSLTDPRTVHDDARRRLLHAWWAIAPNTYLVHHLSTCGLLQPDDLPWLLGELAAADGQPDVAEPIRVAIRLITAPTQAQADIAHAAADDAPQLQPFVNDAFSPARVTAAEHARQEQEAKQHAEQAKQASEAFDTARLHAACTADDWPAVSLELRRNVGSDQFPLGAAITNGPAWGELDDDVGAAVTTTATSWLRDNPPTPDPERRAVDTFAGAVSAATAHDPENLTDHDPDVLLPWLQLLVDKPWVDEAVNALVHALRDTRTSDVEAALVAAVAHETGHPQPFALRRLGGFDSPGLLDALTDLAQHPDATPTITHDALTAIVDRDPVRGIDLAFTLVRARPAVKPSRNLVIDPHNTVHRRWMRAAAAAAAIAATQQVTDHLDELLDELRDVDFASDFVRFIDSTARQTPTWHALTVDQQATLYLWASKTLPPEPDHPTHTVVTSNPVYEFADVTYRRLRDTDTPEAVDALNRIAEDTGEPWPRGAATAMARRLREQAWTPLDPTDVLTTLTQPQHRVVQSEEQLAQLLLDAIDDVQTELDRSPDFAALFWHRQHAHQGTAATYIPRSETEFTTALVLERLEHTLDTVVLRQETQLNLTYAATDGSRLDIEAIVRNGTREICVIVEVKGAWHADVRTAIETQLTDRYLHGRRTNTGIYLVAAFASPSWNSKDSRRTPWKKTSRDDLRNHLRYEAKRLTADGITVHARVLDIDI